MTDAVQPTVSPATIADIEAIERDAWADMYAAAPAQTRDALGIAHHSIDDGALLICRKIDHIQFNRLSALGIRTPASAQALEQAIHAFDDAGVKNWVVQVAAGASALEELCASRGLTPHPRTWAKFIRDAKLPTSPSTDLTVREIGVSEAQAFGSTGAAAFGMPPPVAPWLAAIVGRPHWRCFMAFDNRNPVATGATYIDGHLAWFGIGATLQPHRGRGAQSAILAARIEAAIAAGATVLATETGIPHPGETGPSYANIQRAAFRIAYPRPNLRRA